MWIGGLWRFLGSQQGFGVVAGCHGLLTAVDNCWQSFRTVQGYGEISVTLPCTEVVGRHSGVPPSAHVRGGTSLPPHKGVRSGQACEPATLVRPGRRLSSSVAWTPEPRRARPPPFGIAPAPSGPVWECSGFCRSNGGQLRSAMPKKPTKHDTPSKKNAPLSHCPANPPPLHPSQGWMEEPPPTHPPTHSVDDLRFTKCVTPQPANFRTKRHFWNQHDARLQKVIMCTCQKFSFGHPQAPENLSAHLVPEFIADSPFREIVTSAPPEPTPSPTT